MSWSDVIIQFEPKAYLYSQVRDKIEHDTPYDIELPYVDAARQKKFMPAQMSFLDCMNWIIAYFEKENRLTLNFQLSEHRVLFRKASSLPEEEQKKILSKKLSLVGKKWTLHKAIQSAGEQSDIKITLPFKDKKLLTADYNYECSLGEFIEEVRLYWKSQMGYRIHAIIEKNEIGFYKGGKIIVHNLKENVMLKTLKHQNFATLNQAGDTP